MNRTRIAAPAMEPFDELFAFLDSLTVRQLAAFVARVRRRWGVL